MFCQLKIKNKEKYKNVSLFTNYKLRKMSNIRENEFCNTHTNEV